MPSFRVNDIDYQILVDGGPLAVSVPWDFKNQCTAEGIYAVYLKRDGLKVSPYYASLKMAHAGMKKILAEFPAPIWAQPLEWLRRQTKLKEWLDKKLGKKDELIGGIWLES